MNLTFFLAVMADLFVILLLSLGWTANPFENDSVFDEKTMNKKDNL